MNADRVLIRVDHTWDANLCDLAERIGMSRQEAADEAVRLWCRVEDPGKALRGLEDFWQATLEWKVLIRSREVADLPTITTENLPGTAGENDAKRYLTADVHGQLAKQAADTNRSLKDCASEAFKLWYYVVQDEHSDQAWEIVEDIQDLICGWDGSRRNEDGS